MIHASPLYKNLRDVSINIVRLFCIETFDSNRRRLQFLTAELQGSKSTINLFLPSDIFAALWSCSRLMFSPKLEFHFLALKFFVPEYSNQEQFWTFDSFSTESRMIDHTGTIAAFLDHYELSAKQGASHFTKFRRNLHRTTATFAFYSNRSAELEFCKSTKTAPERSCMSNG